VQHDRGERIGEVFERGDADAIASTAAAAATLGMRADEILPCSTGVIGEPLTETTASSDVCPELVTVSGLVASCSSVKVR